MHFTSDSHFGHSNIIRYTGRPVLRPGDLDENNEWISKDIRDARTEEMDEIMINNWNHVVPVNGEIYHLGDFSWGNSKKYARQLNGRITIILGNHDKKAKHYRDECGFTVFNGYKDLTIKPGKNEDALYITLCHFAMRTWDRAQYGALHLYGHTHGDTLPPHGKSINIGVDANGYTPVSLEQVLEKAKYLPLNPGYISKEKRKY